MSQPVDQRARRARARSAVSLGAAFAIFGATLLGYDAPASQAAGGFFEALFGMGRVGEGYYDYSYGPRRHRLGHAPHRFRLAHHWRRHDGQARRRVAERRKVAARQLASAPVQQKNPIGPAVIEIIAPARNPFLPVYGAGAVITKTIPATQSPEAGSRGVGSGCARPCVVPAIASPSGRPGGLGEGTPANAFYADPTLRPGDTVITAEGVRILRPGSRYPFKASDFASLAEAGAGSLANRNALSEIERAIKTPIGRPPAGL